MCDMEGRSVRAKHCVVDRHSKTLIESLSNLLETKLLCDVVLMVNGCEFSVHRVVLAANSNYFARMFGGSLTESKSSVVDIQGITTESMRQIIDYSYTSSFMVDENNALDLLAAANMLDYQDIIESCCEFLEDALNKQNCLHIHCLAELYELEQLRNCSMKFIQRNFRSITRAKEFLESDLFLVKTLLDSDELNIVSEKEVFDTVISWIKHDLQTRVEYLPELLKLVRLPLMAPKLLFDIVERNPLVEENDSCMRIVSRAKTCYLTPLASSTEEKWLQPRKSTREEEVFLIGGEVRHEVLDSVDKFIVKDGRWKSLSPMSYSRDGLGVALYEGRIYIAGGYDGKQALTSCEVYNIERDAWKHISPMSLPRHACSLTVHQGWIYALGGSDYASREHCSVEMYDPIRDNWTDVAPLTSKREGLSTVAIYGSIYAIGGDNGIAIVNTMEQYDPRVGHWCRGVSMGYRRRYFGACVLNEKIYVAGGSDFEEEYNSFECFDLRANKWQPLPSMVCRRESLSLLSVGGKIIAFGGSCCNKVTESAESYDPATNNWEPSTPMTRPREGMGGVVLS